MCVLVACIIGTICTSIAIAIIYKMNITGYIKLILAMSWYQLIYDLSYFTDGNDVGNYPVKYLSALGQTIGGLGSGIISNWIAYAVFYIIVYQRSFDIMKYYNKIFVSSIIIMLPIVLLYSIGDIPENAHPQLDLAAGVIYFIVRVVSILINILLVLFPIHAIYELPQEVQASSTYGSRASNQHAIEANDVLSYSSGKQLYLCTIQNMSCIFFHHYH